METLQQKNRVFIIKDHQTAEYPKAGSFFPTVSLGCHGYGPEEWVEQLGNFQNIFHEGLPILTTMHSKLHVHLLGPRSMLGKNHSIVCIYLKTVDSNITLNINPVVRVTNLAYQVCVYKLEWINPGWIAYTCTGLSAATKRSSRVLVNMIWAALDWA